VETSAIEAYTTVNGHHITVMMLLEVVICVSEELPLVCTKDTVVVMK
jgi:alcohol dehydrogenase class IV